MMGETILGPWGEVRVAPGEIRAGTGVVNIPWGEVLVGACAVKFRVAPGTVKFLWGDACMAAAVL